MAGTRSINRKSTPKSSKGAQDLEQSLRTVAALERALSIPEIFNFILEYLDKSTQAACARVCQTWNSPALDRVWKNLDGLVPLLELLSPLELYLSGPEPVLGFRHDISLADWPRFCQYARRVRSLTFDATAHCYGFSNSYIPHSIIASIQLFHPGGSLLLPNIKYLTWTETRPANYLSVLPFVSPTIQKLTLDLGSHVLESDVNRLFQALSSGRTPQLTSFSLSTSIPSHLIGVALSKWLGTVPNLKTISLPKYYQRERIILSLEKLAKLEEIDVNYKRSQRPDENGMTFCWKQGAFVNLTSLAVDASLFSMTRLLQTPTQFSQLTSLEVASDRLASSKQLADFALSAGTALNKLRFLLLDLYQKDDSPTRNTQLLFESLTPMLSECPLTHLEIEHSCPMALTQADVEAIGKGWPNLEELFLCESANHPEADEYSGTPLSLLKVFAEACPKLVELGVYLHHDGPETDEECAFHSDGFRSLRNLAIGSAWVPDRDPITVGCFLASLGVGSSHLDMARHSWDSKPVANGDSKRLEEWGEVQRVADMVLWSKEVARKALGKSEE